MLLHRRSPGVRMIKPISPSFQARYSSRPPEILLTHPLPESRLADARNRANQMRPMVVQSSEDFYLAKARTLGMYNSGRNQLTSDLLVKWA